MPVSERPEVVEEVTEAEPELPLVGRLEAAVERLLEELGGLRKRAAEAEAAYDELRGALEATERTAGAAEDLEERLGRLAEENGRLREMLETARERAERIRSRLMVVEDEL